MILVTGATGNIGGALLRELRAHGAGPVRGLTRDPSRAAFPEGVTAVGGDLGRPATLKAALDGARSLFLVPGSGGEADVLTAAQEAGVEHVVLVSSITVETHPHLPPAAQNHALELALRDSGMAWTVLRPSQFASNTLWWAESIREHDLVRAPYGDVGLPAIHPADIAAVARVALTEPGHRGRTHTLTGPARISPREQVAAIAEARGRAISFEETDRAQAHREMAAFLGDEVAAAVLDLTGGDVNEAILTVRDEVAQLTGAPARTFREWAQEHAAAFR
ncbi:SDR family oxidoreductase [Streptomyces sp. NPDC018031]|uniref:SDR family oxidoreductase n=1 Tax=Streptomyces sp. NPDC018031 TaxID=3365033 RepID=UPI0037B1AC55